MMDLKHGCYKSPKTGQHLQTPTHFVLREFLRTQDEYLDYIDEFALLHKDKYDQEKINSWNRLLINIIGKK